jgi:acetyltransferase-like isoleucine patch superfamily enzyme
MRSQYYRLKGSIERRGRVTAATLRAMMHRLFGVTIGHGCRLGKGVTFIYGWRTRFGNNCIIDAFSQFKCPTAQPPDARYNIDIGDDVFIGRGTIIDSKMGVRIGKNTFIAPYGFITDTHHIFVDARQPIREQGCEYRAVEIGEDVWVGTHVVILPGVKVGKGSVIGANSTVTRDIPPDVVAAGSPARVIGKRS